MTDHITLPRSVVEQAEPQGLLDCEIQARPLAHPLRDYHIAISEGPLHYTWTDKPHRLVYDLIAAVKFYAAPQLAQPVAVPQGWKLVPVEPTPEMRSAACAAIRWYEQEATARAVHAAMLTAAPTPPAATAEEPQDSYDDIWNALQEIETFAVFLPTFEVIHEGGLKACTKNIVEAIKKAANLPPAATVPVLEPLTQAEIAEIYRKCDAPNFIWFEGVIRTVEAAHNAKLAKRGTP